MKLKKITVLSLLAVCTGGLAGCCDKGEEGLDPNRKINSYFDENGKWVDVNAAWKPGVEKFELNVKKEAGDGFISLENTRAHAAEVDGKYTYGGQTFNVKDVYKSFYSTDIQKEKMNYLINQWQYNSEKYTNLIDGLVENDEYGNIIGDLAYAYKVNTNSDNTQTYTFKIRQGVAWISNKDNVIYAEVVADDFVNGLKYVLNPYNASQTAGIVMSQIKGAADYYNAEKAAAGSGDFSKVGIKAVDKYTVEYTTAAVMPYFLSCLTYTPYLPVNQEYLDSEGTDFGATADNLLINGAYRMVSHERNKSIVYSRNADYWDREHVYAKQVQLKYLDGTVTTNATTRELFEAGEIDSFTVKQADSEGWQKYVTGPDNSGSVNNPYAAECNGVAGWGDRTFCGYFNYKRSSFESNATKTDAQKTAANKAVKNANFRLGFLYGFNALEYLKQWDEQEPFQKLNRAWTNYNLTSADGKDYCDYVSDVYNEKNNLEGDAKVNLAGVLQQGDPIYSAEKAKAKFAAAKEELIAGGLTEADFPVTIDVVGSTGAENQAFEKAALDLLLKDNDIKAVMNLNYILPTNDDDLDKWTTQTSDYDFNFLTGWGPDYADPQTYCGCWCYNGDMLNNSGLDGDDALQQEILKQYQDKYEVAIAITDPARTAERYRAFAEAEYTLIYELGIIIPYFSNTGTNASVARTVAHQSGTASYGLTADKFKGVVATDTIINKTMRAAIDAAWNAAK